MRRNAEVRLRELERAAASGDQAAKARLLAHRVRVEAGGDLLRWISRKASIRDLQTLLPLGELDTIQERFTLARHTRPLIPRTGGWFEDHDLQNVCPRGHSIEDYRFWFNESGVRVWNAYLAYPDLLMYSDTGEFLESDLAWAQCSQCLAAWPSRAEPG